MIASFQGTHHFLSNFYLVDVDYEGMKYPSVEHAYQAAKTVDLLQREIIASARTAGAAKRLGRRVIMRPNWDRVKIHIMTQLVMYKFSASVPAPTLVGMLLSTHPHRLIEGNTWGDRFWGAVYNHATEIWEGQNHLGIILMDVREKFFQLDQEFLSTLSSPDADEDY
jgi:ribA/ribD-fused uncharacterized protein